MISTIKDCHNHPPDVAEVEAQKIVSVIKKKASESIQPIPLLYQGEIQQLSTSEVMDEVAAKLPTLPSIKS